jgi:competence protein ComEA
MPAMHARSLLIAASFVLLVALARTALAGASAAEVPGRQSQALLPDAPGRAVVERICLGCHGAEVIAPVRSVVVWRETLELMKGFGAVATDEEWTTIHSYILSNLASLNVNRASADDVAAVFVLDPETATEVIAYREKAGGFTTIDDLKKAPGLDAARVDAATDRISF